MGVVLLVISVIYYEIILSSTSGAVTLPFTDLVATVTPIKPKPLSPEAANGETCLSLPKVPKSSDAILEYYKSQFLEKDLSAIECEFSAPLVLTSSSRTLPVPKIESSTNIKEPTIINSIPENCYTNPSFIQPSPVLTNAYSSKCQPNILSYDLSPSSNIANQYPSVYNRPISTVTLSSLVSDYISGIMPSATAPAAVVSLPSISSLPTVSLQPSSLPIPMYTSLPSLGYTYSIPTTAVVTCPSNLYNQVSYDTAPSLNPLYSVPYPLRYNLLSLPNVVTPSDMPPYNFRPVSYNEIYSSMPNTFSPTNFDNSYTSPSNSARGTRKICSNTDRPYSYDSAKSYSYPQCKTSWQPQKSNMFNPTSDALMANKIKPNSAIDTNTPVYPPSIPLGCCDIVSNTLPVPLNKVPSPPKVKITEPTLLDFEPKAFDFESTLHFINNLKTNIKYPNSCKIPSILSTVDNLVNDKDSYRNNDIANLQSKINVFPSIPKIPTSVPSFIPVQRTSTKNVMPDKSALPSPSDKLFSNILGNSRTAFPYEQNMPQKYFSPTYAPKLPQTTKVPAAYINVSPSYSLSTSSSNAVSSINNIVTNLTQSLLSYLQTYLTSNKPINQRPSNPYVDPQRKYNQVYPTRTSPPTNSYNVQTKRPITSQPTNTPKMTPKNTLRCPISGSFEPYPSLAVTMMPSFADDSSSSSFKSYTPVKENMSPQISETPPLYPVKVTLLPTASFADFSPPRPSLSNLPSPILPSYLDISSSFMETQVRKINSFSKNSKTIERLLELVFLAGLLNGDDYVDWEALDNLLALLC